MAINKQKLLLHISLGSYFFFLGVEYAVILPTINEYLESLNADNTFLGIVLASFSFAGLVTAPIYGYITDKTGSLKACVVVGNLLEVLGNLVYFIGRSKYFVLSGRVLAGLGSGSVSSVLGTLSRTTTEKERTSWFALLMMLRQVGLVIGPGFNVLFLRLNFKIGPFKVNEFTSPGLFMAILWILHTIFFVVVYTDPRQTSGNSEAPGRVQEHEEDTQYHSHENDGEIHSQNQGEIRISINFIQEYLREEIVVLLAASFISIFAQTGIEAAITPMTLMYFDWHGLENSILLLVAGGVVIVGFLLVHFASKRFLDRSLLLGGCVGLAFGYALFFGGEIILHFTESGTEMPSWYFPGFCVDMLIWVISLSFLFVPQVSLFSKLTRTETQAFGQGIRNIALRAGMIVGPLWASPMVTPARLPIMAGVNFFLVCFLAVLIISSFKCLVPPPAIEDPMEGDDPLETSPLLLNS